MYSHFINQFKKTNPEEKLAFRTKVVAIVRELYPDAKLKEGAEFEVLHVNDSICYLSNLYARFLQTNGLKFELRNLVKEYFDATFDVANKIKDIGEDWEDVEHKIFPMLVNKEHPTVETGVIYPFCEEVVIAIVMDIDKSYRYVLSKELDIWDVSKDELYDTGIYNLEKKSKGIPMVAWEGDMKVVGIETYDSYDATRIIIPTIQKMLLKRLGNPFQFGVPNRDFLFCWSVKNSKDFMEFTTERIGLDYKERAYKISPHIFEMDRNSKVRLAKLK